MQTSQSTIQDNPLIIARKIFTSRFFLGTGKFKNKQDVTESILASETQLITVALRRIDLERHEDNILEYIPSSITLMTNTSGARNANEAVRVERLARESECGNWIKVEVIPDPHYLLPDPIETLKASEELVKEGFVVLPYINADPVLAKKLEDLGVAAIMPLGSPIGSNQGIKVEMPVLQADNVVGQVIAVSLNSSKALLITDPSSAVDSIVQNSRVRGTVRGMQRNNLCDLQYVLPEDEVKVGDRLITAGMDKIFPKGLLIGIVNSIEKDTGSMFQKVHIKPSVDFSKLENVLIVTDKKNE